MSHDNSASWSSSDRVLFGLLPPVVLASVALADLAFGFSTSYAGWPFLVSLVLIGMPHGAGDLVVNGRLAGRRSWSGYLRVFTTYVALMVVTLAAFVAWPLTTLLLFGVVTALHFGTADVEDLRGRGDRELADLATRLPAVLARGTLIIALPFAVQPVASLQVVADVAGLVGGTVPAATADAVQSWAWMAVGLAGLCWAGTLLVRAAEGRLRDATTDAGEVGVLALAFSVLNPLFAMGLYFLGWHSWRHTRHLHRFLDDDERFDFGGFARLHTRALPLLVPTLAAAAAVTWWSGLGWSATSLATVSIAAFVVVTPPHHLVVERLHARLRTDTGDDVASPGAETTDRAPTHRRIAS